jgi:hypothetical protein
MINLPRNPGESLDIYVLRCRLCIALTLGDRGGIAAAKAALVARLERR